MKKYLLLLLVPIVMGGCITNPVTGEKEFDPNVADKISIVTLPAEKIAEVAAPYAGAVHPMLGTLVTVLSLAFAGWNKRQSNKAKGLTKAIVSSISDFRALYPDDWGKLRNFLVNKMGPTSKAAVDAIIEELKAKSV